MSRIAVMVAEGFEESEYIRPVEAFKDAGHEVINVGLEAGTKVTGKHNTAIVAIDVGILDVDIDTFDALYIPGGYSPDKLREYREPVDFVRMFVQMEKPVFSICHGAQLLISADVLRGRSVTGWKSIKKDILNAGADYKDQAVVIDGNLISSRQPSDLLAFIDAVLAFLAQES